MGNFWMKERPSTSRSSGRRCKFALVIPTNLSEGFPVGVPCRMSKHVLNKLPKTGLHLHRVKVFQQVQIYSDTSVWQSWCEFCISLYLWFVKFKWFRDTISELLSPPFLSKFQFASFSVTLNSFFAVLLQNFPLNQEHESIKGNSLGNFWIFNSILFSL